VNQRFEGNKNARAETLAVDAAKISGFARKIGPDLTRFF
jgi:hypothetical protein